MARAQQQIQAFGRISKASTNRLSTKKRKASPESAEILIEASGVANDRKKRLKGPQTPSDTPTKAISLKFANLELTQRSPTPIPTGTRRERKNLGWTTFEDTPPTSPSPSYDAEEQDTAKADHPKEIGELKALNSALLNALSLHYAHHGAASPLDIRRLTPSITRLWGRRKVNLIDIERCFGLLQLKNPRDTCQSPFQLIDYGRGRICIELSNQPRTRPTRAHFDQDGLSRLFDGRIEDSWSTWSGALGASASMSGEREHRIVSFLDQLPRAVIKLSPTASKTAQALTLAKGQKRLRDVLDGRESEPSTKRDLIVKRRKMHDAESPAAEQLSVENGSNQMQSAQGESNSPLQQPEAPVSRGQSLLDRIRAKQMHAATLPAAPTREQLARVAALHRAEEVISILDLLVAQRNQGPRASFPTQALVQSVQNSLRSPMSKEEVEKCLALLQNEIAAGYVKVLKMGAMNGVVVDMSQKPRKELLKERLRASGA